jgi:hypothetical protein
MGLKKIKNHKLFAYCGLYCSSCSVFIASQEDPARLQIIANKMNRSVEETRCNGCRSEKLSSYCLNCDLKICAISKGIDFCSECNDYPCSKLKSFQKKMPHRSELFDSLDYVKNNSIEKWEEKMIQDFSCPKCGKINSPYFINCKKCNTFPGNKFIERNLEKIKNYLKIK